MAELKILIWDKREPVGDPDLEVKVPTTMARWLPRMMKFIPKQTKERWGEGVDFDALFADVEQMLKEMTEKGERQMAEVKSMGTTVKITLENQGQGS
jgi:hypothetical protein